MILFSFFIGVNGIVIAYYENRVLFGAFLNHILPEI